MYVHRMERLSLPSGLRMDGIEIAGGGPGEPVTLSFLVGGGDAAADFARAQRRRMRLVMGVLVASVYVGALVLAGLYSPRTGLPLVAALLGALLLLWACPVYSCARRVRRALRRLRGARQQQRVSPGGAGSGVGAVQGGNARADASSSSPAAGADGTDGEGGDDAFPGSGPGRMRSRRTLSQWPARRNIFVDPDSGALEAEGGWGGVMRPGLLGPDAAEALLRMIGVDARTGRASRSGMVGHGPLGFDNEYEAMLAMDALATIMTAAVTAGREGHGGSPFAVRFAGGGGAGLAAPDVASRREVSVLPTFRYQPPAQRAANRAAAAAAAAAPVVAIPTAVSDAPASDAPLSAGDEGTGHPPSSQPTVVVESINEDPGLCSVCLDEFAAGDRLRMLPCMHKFHAKCVDRWLLQSKASCPVCKTSIRARLEEPQVLHVRATAAADATSAPSEASANDGVAR
jgi:hypothetical protein